jgi:hypothetical protein
VDWKLMDMHYHEAGCCGQCIHGYQNSYTPDGHHVCKLADEYVSSYGTCNRYEYKEEAP